MSIQTTTLTGALSPSAVRPSIRSVVRAALEPLRRLDTWRTRRGAIHALRRLDERLLRDIGIHRGQIEFVVDGLLSEPHRPA